MAIRQYSLASRLIRNSLFTVAALVISSCGVDYAPASFPADEGTPATLPPVEPPLPPMSSWPKPTQAPATSGPPEPTQAPAPPPVTTSKPASNLLLASARGQLQAGDTSRAAATLERALRIAPNDPYLWHELAQVRFAAGEWQQAIQLANKSRVLAGSDIELRNKNSDLIAAASERM